MKRARQQRVHGSSDQIRPAPSSRTPIQVGDTQACTHTCHCARSRLTRLAPLRAHTHHILLPLMRKLPSGCLSARVAMANASEPEPASLRQKEPRVSVARRGSQRFFSSSLPHFRMLVLISVF